MITFKQFLDEALEHQAGSETTQVATTTGTYQKTAEKIKGLIKKCLRELAANLTGKKKLFHSYRVNKND